LGGLGERKYVERKEFLECWYSSKLFLELEKDSKVEEYCEKDFKV
jgi:hypothetical protein